MEDWGKYKDREIYYLSTASSVNWVNELPKEGWLALIIADERDIEAYSYLANKCLVNKVSYVCTVGKACELIHDIFDEEIVGKRIDKGLSVESKNDFENSPMTDWHNDFEEGVWFALVTANDPSPFNDFNKVVCIDTTTNTKRRQVFELVEKIKKGYVPPDN